MKERPILFSAPMVRAILEGRKTQTRRTLKPQPQFIKSGKWNAWAWPSEDKLKAQWADRLNNPNCILDFCPYGKPGDLLWVRETWACLDSKVREDSRLAYRSDTADGERVRVDAPWRPSIHMPRGASRITLEITDVRVQRLQDISPDDAQAEGYEGIELWMSEKFQKEWCNNSVDVAAQRGEIRPFQATAEGWFKTLWNSINGVEAWRENPWIWVISFRKVEA